MHETVAPFSKLLPSRALSNIDPAEGGTETVLITGANCHPSHHQQVGTCLSAAQGVDSTVRQLLQLRRQLAPLQGVGFGQALLQLSLSTPP